MINHARTLLLNRDGAGFHGHAGEEYTPPDYHAVELPSFCHNVRRVLFGQRPDALMYMYRARELMQMLHATELEQFVLDLDPRITYSFGNTDQPFEEVFPFQRDLAGRTVVTQLGATTAELFPTTGFETPDIKGQCFQQWYIRLTGSQFELTHQTSPRKLVTETGTFSSGLSARVQLPESSLGFMAQEGSGSEWMLEAYTRPQRGLGDLEAAMASLTEETTSELFHIGDPQGNQEPWKTFRNLWKDHDETAYRLGTIVLALIYHTHEIWDVG